MEKLLNDQAEYVRDVAYTGGFTDEFITAHMALILECFERGDSVADCADVIWESDDQDDDGQPDEYTEWQDYMGGDDWDHGQYGDDF